MAIGDTVTLRILPGVNDAQPDMGCTFQMFSDRVAGTISEVKRFRSGPRAGQVREVVMVSDHAIRTDTNGVSDCQTYRFEPNPDGRRYRFTVRDGILRNDGGRLILGIRDHFYDYSF